MASFAPTPADARPPPSGTANTRRGVPQPFFAYVPNPSNTHRGWRTARPLTPAESAPLPEPTQQQQQPSSSSSPSHPLFTRLHVLTWNIDFSRPESVARMSAALDHMHSIIEAIPESDAVVIFFQEMTYQSLHVIHETDWVRERFYNTDLVPKFWMSGYGTATLIDRRLAITGEGVWRLRLRSEFGRDGLFVDLLMRSASTSEDDNNNDDDTKQDPPKQEDKILRLCNVHLESLAANPPIRPTQFATLAPHLHPSSAVHAAVMAGDTNAIRPYDETLPAEHGLTDVYLALGGVEGDAAGHTWGYQSGRTRYPPARLDKILLAGEVRATRLRRFGIGVLVDDLGARARLENFGEEEFVTDHYGLRATCEIEGGMGLVRAHDAWRPLE